MYLCHDAMYIMDLHECHIDKDNTFRLVIGVYRKNTYFECQIDRSFAVKGKLIFVPSAMPCHCEVFWNLTYLKTIKMSHHLDVAGRAIQKCKYYYMRKNLTQIQPHEVKPRLTPQAQSIR